MSETNNENKEQRNKFEQELFLREQEDETIHGNINDTLINGFKSIVKNNIGTSYKYMVDRFITLCNTIHKDLVDHSNNIDNYPLVQYVICRDSFPPKSIDVLITELKSFGFIVHVSEEENNICTLTISYGKGGDIGETNNQDRDTEFSEPQEHSN